MLSFSYDIEQIIISFFYQNEIVFNKVNGMPIYAVMYSYITNWFLHTLLLDVPWFGIINFVIF